MVERYSEIGYTPESVLQTICEQDENQIVKAEDLVVGACYRFGREKIRVNKRKWAMSPCGYGQYLGERDIENHRIVLHQDDTEHNISFNLLKPTAPFYDQQWRGAFADAAPDLDDRCLRDALALPRAGIVLTNKDLPYTLDKTVQFQNYMELWFALLLERHKIHYHVAPEVKTRCGLRTPDFYIPEWDHYIEVTLSIKSKKSKMVRDLQWVLTAEQISIISHKGFQSLFDDEEYLAASWDPKNWIKRLTVQATLDRNYGNYQGPRGAARDPYENWKAADRTRI